MKKQLSKKHSWNRIRRKELISKLRNRGANKKEIEDEQDTTCNFNK